jgi:anti-sigma regulatory factor (Ser/Thr protein kinase)
VNVTGARGATHEVCPISEESAVGAARRTAARLALEAGLPETEAGRVGIVVTELARNIVLHAGQGQLLLQVWSMGGTCGVEAIAVDAGPGMDVDGCLRDGYSTAGTAGTGLGAVRRLASEFDAWSRPGTGTIVLARVLTAPAPPPAIQVGAVATCAPGESTSGDAWSVAVDGHDVAMLVADGLGHGALAGLAANGARAVFDQHPFGSTARYFADAHERLRSTRGAAVALAQYAKATDTLTYAGVGNVAGALLAPDGRARGLVSHNGTVGATVRQGRELTYHWSQGDLLVMYSDGLKGVWNFDRYPGLLAQHPAVVAAAVHRDYLRGRDDATIVVVRRAGAAAP